MRASVLTDPVDLRQPKTTDSKFILPAKVLQLRQRVLSPKISKKRPREIQNAHFFLTWPRRVLREPTGRQARLLPHKFWKTDSKAVGDVAEFL